jgi:hypothetical protein
MILLISWTPQSFLALEAISENNPEFFEPEKSYAADLCFVCALSKQKLKIQIFKA